MSASDKTPANAGPEQVEIFLPSTLGYEKVARSAAEAVAEEMGFSEDRIDDLKTAVAEAWREIATCVNRRHDRLRFVGIGSKFMKLADCRDSQYVWRRGRVLHCAARVACRDDAHRASAT